MKILLQDIPQGHSIMDRREPADRLDLEAWFHPTEPVEAVFDLERRGERLTIRGRAELEGEQICARCTQPFRFRLGADFLVVSEPRGSEDPRDEAALERDGEILFHDGNELVLDGAIREALILEVPVVMLCRPDCKGLCPHCGKDLNEGACSCSVSSGDPRWEVLRDRKEQGS